ncbi:hypothetical protein FUAX_55120 (plasmid) [Fulvitalea axinellae]|uniref:Uncharacterized protein n=1 Tax=Fulvitalea axinellae TaxID=1182444 RepID=A0AAU9DKN4_9BACT|nr:hypothetical protein FUAX_55120 [Fulvitalea axinellae]
MERNIHKSGMVEFPHTGTEVTGSGTVGQYSINNTVLYEYYNRNDVTTGVEDHIKDTILTVSSML